MDVEHQILQVGVDTGLRVNGGLLISKQVVELDNADGDGFKLLGLEHDLFEHGVLDYLVGHDGCEVARLRNVPPVIAVQRRIQVVPQTLHTHQLLSFYSLKRESSTYLKDLE